MTILEEYFYVVFRCIFDCLCAPFAIIPKQGFFLLFSEDYIFVKLALLFVFGVLCAYFLASVLFRNAWFLRFLEKLSSNLWIYFLLASPFYVLKPVTETFNTGYTVENVLIFVLVFFGFLFLITSFYANRGSDKLYGWLILNTKIRVSLVIFSLVSISLFYFVFGGEINVQGALSASLVIKLSSLEAVISSKSCLLLLQSFFLTFSLFLSAFVSFLVWVSEQPFLVIFSNFLVSGIIIRGLFLHPFLLDALNTGGFFSESVESTQMMLKVFNVKATLPELLGKTVIVPKLTPFNYPRMYEKSFSIFANANLENISLFLKKQEPFSQLKKSLPFPFLEKMLLDLKPTDTSLQHKQFVLYFVFESHRTGKSANEIVIDIAQKLGLFNGTAEEIDYKLGKYNLKLSNQSSLSIDSLNAVDLANAEKIYMKVSLLRSQYSPQQLAITAHYLYKSPYSKVLQGLPLTDTWSENFSATKVGADFRSQQLLQTRETMFQLRLYLDPSIQVLDNAQFPWASLAAQKSVLNAAVHLRADILGLESRGQVVSSVNSVGGNHLGDFKLHLVDGTERYVDVTEVAGESTLRLVENPESVPDIKEMVNSVWTLALEKFLHNDPKVYTSVHVPVISANGEEFAFLLSHTSQEFEVARKNLRGFLRSDLVKTKANFMQYKNSQIQLLEKRARLTAQISQLKNVNFRELLEKTVITTSENFKK